MSERIATHQLFEYSEEEPFHFIAITRDTDKGDALINHWHEELEVAFFFAGHSRHYINGEYYEAGAGRLIVTNSEFIHNIITVEEGEEDDVAAVVVIIHPKFITNNFPEFQDIYFTNDKLTASEGIRNVMEKIRDYIALEESAPYRHLYGKSLVLELLFHMSQEGIVLRKDVDNVNVLKNIERIKGVLQFIENHYREHITQEAVAGNFYFSPVYFSRYFKKCTGMTFTDYLALFRLNKAMLDLLETNKSVSQIALDNGFSDDRRLIVTFKKRYGTTPLQYKKRLKNREK